MDERNLTLEAFWKLSLEERCERYRYLSEHDKLRVRQAESGVVSAPCNDCVHYFEYAKCAAYPNGISGDHIQAVMDDLATPCGESFRYQKKQSTNVR